MKLVKQLQATVEKQGKELARLKAKSKPTSRNSSTPPSADPNRKRASKGPSSRKQGGQPGHKGHSSKPLPPDEVFAVKPGACAGCGLALTGDDPEPHRHQVVEIPPISIFVTEHQLHALACGGCGHTTRATLPDGVQQSQFGPNASAIIATLTGRYRVSRRDTKQLMADMFGLRVSLGSISNIEARVSNGLAPFHAEAMEDMQDADVKHADETTWRQRGQSAYFWLAATLTTVACLIRNTRSGEVAKELLGETPTGITVSDRYVAYNYMDEGQRQVCWAHLRRDFVAMAEGEQEHRSIGVKLLKLTDEMFERWHSLRDGEVTRGQFAGACLMIRIKMFALLEKGATSRGHRTPSLCRGILKTEGPMWTFVDVDGVEPTNNDAERAIRPAVIARKTSFGTQSDRGSRFVERMLTASGTLARRDQSLFGFVREAAASALGLGQAPTLRS
jgi:transposase